MKLESVMLYVLCRTDMDEEVAVSHDKLDMSWEQIAQCFIRGAQAAFIDDPKAKQALIDTVTRRTNAWVQKQNRISAEKAHKEHVRKGMMKTSIIAAWVALSGCIMYGNMQ